MLSVEAVDRGHRRTGRGGEGGGGGGGGGPPPPPPPQILGNSDFLGSKRKFGQSQLLKTFSCFLLVF